jgi:hypothetical protein
MNAKTLAALLLSAAVAVSAFADEGKLIPVATAEGAPRTVAEAVKQLRATGTRTRHVMNAPKLFKAGVRPNVIEYETADSAFLIPAAGSVQGSNGTFFRSDVTIGNFNGVDQNIGVGFLVQGQDNTKQPLTHFIVPANSVVTINDFVATQLKTSGLGALIFFAFDAAGATTDTEAFIDGFSRIWTPQPGTTNGGTVSQSFPAVSLLDSSDNFTAFTMGLRADSNFRTNAGIVNLDTVAHTWTVASINTGQSMTVVVQPFSLSQPGVPVSFGSSAGNLSLTFDVDATQFFWSAYASSVDNRTGDGWVSRATQ